MARGGPRPKLLGPILSAGYPGWVGVGDLAAVEFLERGRQALGQELEQVGCRVRVRRGCCNEELAVDLQLVGSDRGQVGAVRLLRVDAWVEWWYVHDCTVVNRFVGVGMVVVECHGVVRGYWRVM